MSAGRQATLLSDMSAGQGGRPQSQLRLKGTSPVLRAWFLNSAFGPTLSIRVGMSWKHLGEVHGSLPVIPL